MDDHGRGLFLWQDHRQRAEERHPHGRGQLDQDAQLQREDLGCAPAEDRHRAEDEAARRDRKNTAQVADDLARVVHRVLREEDRVEGPVLDARPQHVDDHGAVDADQPTDAAQGKAVAQLDGRELGGDDDQQREALRPVRHAGAEQADRLERDAALDLELQDAGVLLVFRVKGEIAPADDRLRVEDQPRTVRWLGVQHDVDRP